MIIDSKEFRRKGKENLKGQSEGTEKMVKKHKYRHK